MVETVIIGTGDHAYGLSHLFKNNNCGTSGNYLRVTKPGLRKGGSFHETGVPLAPFEDALSNADIVIFAIPAVALKTLVAENIHLLKRKVLVDATNSSVRGEDLHSILAVTDVRWVKAFNDIGAVETLLNKPFGKLKIPATICSRYPEAAKAVKEFSETSLGMDIKVVPYERYSDIALHQDSVGEDWVKSAWLMLLLFCFTEFYAVLR